MDRVEEYRKVVETVFSEYAARSPSHDQLETKLIADREQDDYVLMTIGWATRGRVHDVFGHVHLKDGKIWIEEDGTEKGFAVEFMEAGVPKEDIVLAFYRPERRELTDFAVA